jgi:peptide/nickel transport system substrate-binding protein
LTTAPKTSLLRLLAAIAALAMLAAACSSSDDAGGDEDVVADEAEEAQTEEVEAGESAGEDIRDDEEVGDPVHGGTLIYGVEADVARAWAPYNITCSISCAMPLGAISDPLFDFDPDGNLIPVLAEGIESNEDATVWTMTMREGVLFQDGTPVDAAAMQYNFNVCRASSGRGQDFVPVEDIVVIDDLTVEFRLSEPWSAFPAAALDTPCGTHTMAPSWLKTLPSNPLREESRFTGTDLIDPETVDTPPEGDETIPVSHGPFQVVSYTPGNGNGTIVERNPTYWRGDEGAEGSVTGEGLPYLDGIEFVIVVDIASRSAGLRSGEFDIMHTANADEIAAFRDEEGFVRIEANKFGETSFFLINHATAENGLDPDGANATNPNVDVRVRRALAHAMDRQRIADERGAGIVQVANGPFAPGQPGFLEDNGYPEYDPDAGLELLEEYVNDPERSDGKAVGDPISFAFNTTNDPFNVETNQLVVSMWEEAFGDLVDITVTPIEQGQYVQLGVNGTYEVQGWRQHGGTDHDTQLRFWVSSTAAPIGSPTFNFGRFAFPELDELAAASRIETDQAKRIEIFEDMNRMFGENVYYYPTVYTLWGIIAGDYVQDIAPLPLPDGGETFPVISGAHAVTQVWCTEGVCE